MTSSQLTQARAEHTETERPKVRRRVLIVCGAVVAASGLAIFILLALNRHASLVLIGSMSGLQLSSLLAVLLIIALTTLIVALIAGRWMKRNVVVELAGAALIMIVGLAGVAAAVGMMWAAAFGGVNSYVRIAVPGANGSYVIATQSWFHTSYQLFEGNGLVFSSVPVVFPTADAATDSFAHRNYTVEMTTGGWTLHYSSTGSGQLDTTVFIPRSE